MDGDQRRGAASVGVCRQDRGWSNPVDSTAGHSRCAGVLRAPRGRRQLVFVGGLRGGRHRRGGACWEEIVYPRSGLGYVATAVSVDLAFPSGGADGFVVVRASGVLRAV